MCEQVRGKVRSIVASSMFEGIVQFLIIASIISIIVESELAFNQTYATIYEAIRVMDMVFIALFALEYCLRIYTAKRKRDYIFSFWGVIDLIAILPVLLYAFDVWMIGENFAALRALRIMRLFKLIRLRFLALAIKRLQEALKAVWCELIVFLFLSLIIVFIAACGIYIFEGQEQSEKFGTIMKSAWWAFATLTTIGYGDVTPITAGGKFFAGVVGFIGIAIFALPSALLAASLMKKEEDNATPSATPPANKAA